MKKKPHEILDEMYRRIYKLSTPSVDWDELKASAPVNEKGQKVIPYPDHVCSRDVQEAVVNAVLREYKVPKILHSTYHNSVAMGCSPRYE